MSNQNDLLDSILRFDPVLEINTICDFIRAEVLRRGKRGVVLGLSGGLDSSACAYLCARCLPADQIHLISLPERDSSSAPHDHARKVARMLGIPLEEKNLSGLFRLLGLYDEVPSELANNRPLIERSLSTLRILSGSPAFYPWAQEYEFSGRRGVLGWILRRIFWQKSAAAGQFIIGKVRARMLMLSSLALQLDCLLICTTDRSEWSVGFYDPHGDGVGDIAPLRHLYKTQIRVLAAALGVPSGILQQPSSGDLAAGLPNETAIGLPYEQLDRVLAGLSINLNDAQIALAAGTRIAMVKSIRSACRIADQRRSYPIVIPRPSPKLP